MVSKYRVMRGALGVATMAVSVFTVSPAQSADWSVTEVQFQYGSLKSPFAGGDSMTSIVTLQHASGYSFGDVFFFVDFIDDEDTDAFNDKEAYGEFYAYF